MPVVTPHEDFLVSATRGWPVWGYLHGGRAYHARRREGDRRAVCGAEPKERARWRGSYQLRITTIQDLYFPRRHECSRCRRELRGKS